MTPVLAGHDAIISCLGHRAGGDPHLLTDGTARRGYRAMHEAWPTGGWSMRRIDLATFLIDEVERNEHEREIVGLASA